LFESEGVSFYFSTAKELEVHHKEWQSKFDRNMSTMQREIDLLQQTSVDNAEKLAATERLVSLSMILAESEEAIQLQTATLTLFSLYLFLHTWPCS
jgi:hypothetical protein